ncbi:MAG: hypothetical protein V4726_05640 [Verrucomicrobiota bacterium]
METPIELPPLPGTRELSWVMDSAVSRSQSPFTLAEQVYVWPGQRWGVILKLPSMGEDDALSWQAFFADLNAMAGTFWLPETSFLRIREIDFGLAELDGAHVSGATVRTRGWTPDMRVLKKGQKIEIGGRFRMVLEDVYSTDAGKALVRCWPHCRSLPDSMAVEWQAPRGVFRPASVPEFTWDKNRLQAGFQFSASEAILP